MTKLVNLYDAKTHLSSLIDEAVNGADIVIAKNGAAKVRLTPTFTKDGKNRVLGQWKHFMKGDTRTPEEWWRDWKAADAEIEKDFEDAIDQDWKKLGWLDTSSTRTRSSGAKRKAPNSHVQRAKPSRRVKTKSS